MTNVGSTTSFDHGDWLGTERARTDVNGAIAETCQGLPFGDGLSCSGTDVSPLHFTGKQRDSETGLDYFGARSDSSSTGRFMTPDPGGIGAYPEVPQSWNMYVYTADNPLTYTDLSGESYCKVNKKANTLGGCVSDKAYQKNKKKYKGYVHASNDQTAVVNGSNVTSADRIAAISLGTQEANTAVKPLSYVFVAFIGLGTGILDAGLPEAGLTGLTVGDAESTTEIVAADGTRIRGLTRHGVMRAIGDSAGRAGVKPSAIIDALKNPIDILRGVDAEGRPFEIFTGEDARVVVNPSSGQVVSVNPLSGAGAH